MLPRGGWAEAVMACWWPMGVTSVDVFFVCIVQVHGALWWLYFFHIEWHGESVRRGFAFISCVQDSDRRQLQVERQNEVLCF